MVFTKSKVACVTDIHIGIHQNSAVWHTIATKFAKWFKSELKKNDIKDIIICGDLNDDRSEIDVSSLHVLNRMFSLWKDFNIFIIVGNHDAYYKDRSDVNSISILEGWPNIKIIDKPEVIEAFGKKIGFTPWGTELENIPKCDMLFGHYEINGFNLSKVKTCTRGLTAARLLDKSPFVVSGHFHLRNNRKYKKGRILYVGSPYEMNWGDCGTDPRGFYYLDLKTGEQEFVENKISPRHKKIRFSELTSAGKVTESIRKEFPGNFVTLIIDQDIDDEKLELFLTSLNSLGANQIKVDYFLEDRFSVEENDKEFDSVDIRKCMSDFLDVMEDVNHKDRVKETLLDLYKELVE